MLISRSYRLRHLPLRLATGAYILNAGLGKRHASDEVVDHLQSSAAKVIPAVKGWDKAAFRTAISTTEMTVGGLLLAPFVSSRLAGAALGAFSGGLLTMYLRTPELRLEGSVRPSPAGSAIAKDSWMFGIALNLLIDGRRRR